MIDNAQHLSVIIFLVQDCFIKINNNNSILIYTIITLLLQLYMQESDSGLWKEYFSKCLLDLVRVA